MKVFLLISVLLIVFLTLLADPAPVNIEIEDIFLIALPFIVAFCCLASITKYRLKMEEQSLFLAILIYLSYLFISALIGIIKGVPFLSVLRSIGPYINFMPLIFIGFLPPGLITPKKIAGILITIGLIQALYNVYLYFSASFKTHSTLDVLVNRITLIDPRTTLPIILAVAILPACFFFNSSLSKHLKVFTKIMGLAFILLGILASMVTLTRAIILSIVFGWVVYLIFYLYIQCKVSKRFIPPISKELMTYGFGLFTFGIIILNLPTFHLIASGLAARFYHYAAFNNTDYSNGRLYDEWIPALSTWMKSGYLSLFFGIGAGNTFTVLSGEHRTYIHNLCIYSLVYGGFFGLFSCLWFYFTILRVLILRAIQTQELIYVAFAALLASIFLYGQLFAVHKDFAFNLMLFLIVTTALSRQIETNKLIRRS